MAQEGKKPIGKIILIVVVALIAIGAIGSMAGKGTKSEKAASSDSSATEQAEQDTEEQEPYTIAEEAEDRSNQYDFKITGVLTNNTDAEKSYISVEYVLYDADGNQIGTALANTNNLKAGGTWKYEATSFKTPEEVASWERAEVTGF